MKNLIVLITLLLLINDAMCQVGALNLNPNQSAELDLTSANKGLLIPRIYLTTNTNNPSPVSSPSTGLIVFNIGSNQPQGFYYWSGSAWTLLKSPTGMEVSGPGFSTDNAIVRFDGTTGKIIQNSQIILSDLSNITSVNNLSVGGFTLTTSPADGKILMSNNIGQASWESAPPIDVEEDDITITLNANTLNLEGGTNVIENSDLKATIRLYDNNVTNDLIQLSCSESIDVNNLITSVTIPWDIENQKDYSSFVHSNSTNPSQIQVLFKGIYEINYMFSLINQTIMRKTVRAQLLKNGNYIIPYVNSYSFSYQDADNEISHVSCSFLIELDANDYIELITNGQTNPGPINLIPYESLFFMRLMRKL